MPTYNVKFVTNAHANSFGFRGTKGTATVEPGRIVLETKNPGFFGFGRGTRTEAFDFSEVVNATRAGTAVRFEIPQARERLKWKPGNTSMPFFQFWADDEAAAIAIEQALPRTQTQEYAQEVAEVATFEERLKETTPIPWVSPALVAINFAVFGMMAVGGAGLFTLDPAVHIGWGSNYGPFTTDGQWWRLFTSMFLHFGLIHIALNMWALWDLGRLAERLYGNFVFLALYVLAGLAGSIASVSWNHDVNSAGASGAIFGVLGALLAYMLDKRNGVPMSVMKKHRNASLAFIAYSLAYGFGHKGIDNAAHIGGLVAGMILGFTMARSLDPARRQGIARIAISIAVATVVLMLFTLPLRGVGEQFREDQKFREVLNAASARETKSVTAAKDIAAAAQKGLLTGPQMAARFEADVAAAYRQSAAEIRNIRLDSSSKLTEHHQMATRYFNSRVEAYDLMLDAMARNDEAKIKAATEKLLEGNRIVSEFNAKKSAGKAGK